MIRMKYWGYFKPVIPYVLSPLAYTVACSLCCVCITCISLLRWCQWQFSPRYFPCQTSHTFFWFKNSKIQLPTLWVMPQLFLQKAGSVGSFCDFNKLTVGGGGPKNIDQFLMSNVQVVTVFQHWFRFTIQLALLFFSETSWCFCHFLVMSSRQQWIIIHCSLF